MVISCVGHILNCLNKDVLHDLCEKQNLKVSGVRKVLHHRLVSFFKSDPYKVLISLNRFQLKQICQNSVWEEDGEKYCLDDNGTKPELIDRIIAYCNENFPPKPIITDNGSSFVDSLKFIRTIGSGGFGKADLYENMSLKKKLIVKELYSSNSDSVKKLLKEARILAKVDKNPVISG